MPAFFCAAPGYLRIITAVFTLTGLLSTTQAQSPATSDAWRSELYADHSLAGKIWHSAERRFIDHDELETLLKAADVLLLGEKHDNPDHHRLRHRLLQSLLPAPEQALLVMEMMTQNQQPAIDAFSTSKPLPDAGQWPALLEWDQAWTWDYYQPVISLVLETGSRLLAGNISADRMMEVYRADAAVEESVLSEQQRAQLAEEIDASHCGMLPEAQIPAMVRVQQARDQRMAEALMTAENVSQRILLAGNYHIRRDLSVPNYLGTSGTDEAGNHTTSDQSLKVMNLAFLEVVPGLTAPTDYLAAADSEAEYDLIWFTPAIRADDYCADLAP